MASASDLISGLGTPKTNINNNQKAELSVVSGQLKTGVLAVRIVERLFFYYE